MTMILLLTYVLLLGQITLLSSEVPRAHKRFVNHPNYHHALQACIVLSVPAPVTTRRLQPVRAESIHILHIHETSTSASK